MNGVDTLIEYINLVYRVEKRSIKLQDKAINSTTLLRRTEEGDTIYYLTTGNSLFIPYGWLDLFDGLYFYDGDKLLMHDPDNSYLDKFIYEWMRYEKLKDLGSLAKICTLGTDEFRDWIKDKFNLTLYPIKLTTDYNNIREI